MKEYHSEYKTWIQNYFQKHEDDLITAGQLYQAMQEAGMKVNQATVYRNLTRMVENGILAEHKSNNHEERYFRYVQKERDCAHHLHMYCRNCGKVIHLDGALMEEIAHKVMKEYGFELDCRQSSLVGLCADCRREVQA